MPSPGKPSRGFPDGKSGRIPMLWVLGGNVHSVAEAIETVLALESRLSQRSTDASLPQPSSGAAVPKVGPDVKRSSCANDFAVKWKCIFGSQMLCCLERDMHGEKQNLVRCN